MSDTFTPAPVKCTGFNLAGMRFTCDNGFTLYAPKFLSRDRTPVEGPCQWCGGTGVAPVPEGHDD